jgi:hypothetical protein
MRIRFSATNSFVYTCNALNTFPYVPEPTTDSFPGFRKKTESEETKSAGRLGRGLSRLIFFFTFRVRGVGAFDCLCSCLALADAGSVGALLGGSLFLASFWTGSFLWGAALNFWDISGLGVVATDFEVALKAKLNFEDAVDCEPGPVGAGRLGGGISLSPSLPGVSESSICRPLEGLKGF